MRSFRVTLARLPPGERDAWVDRVLGLGEAPADGPELPRGGVPYLPCPVDALLRFATSAAIGADDVVVDVGAGVGRAALVLHALSGARVIGVEVQPALVAAARETTARLGMNGQVSFVLGDALEETAALATGTAFFLYCPFSGERLASWLAKLEPATRGRVVRVGCVDLAPLACDWLAPVGEPAVDLTVYRSIVR